MRLDWLEDILAVIDTGSIRAAAERRCISQPAFSRRLRAIEERLGVELFDRSRKPVAIHPVIAEREAEFRQAARRLREMGAELRRAAHERHGRIVIASQHAITATLAPGLLDALFAEIELTVRLRSANREDCLALMMTRQAAFALCYQSGAEFAADGGGFLARLALGRDRLVPVIAASALARLEAGWERGELPVVAFPESAFLGRVFIEEVGPRLPAGLTLRRRVETALTLAAHEMALAGLGVAWLPESVARPALAAGRLAGLGDRLPGADLHIVALRLRLAQGGNEERVWKILEGLGGR